MTTGGWITFILSVTSVTLLFLWCIYKVLTTTKKQEMMGDDMFKDDKE